MSNALPKIGDTFTTKNAGYTGIVEAIEKNATGTYRIKMLLPNGDTKYTTYTAPSE